MPNDASRKDPHKLALVIGIGDYDHIPKLNNPKNDAEAMSAKLESIGFTVKRVFHPNRLEMKVAGSEFEESINESDMVLFYFAGHGVQWEVRIEASNVKQVSFAIYFFVHDLL
ncbi:unnamed protein product [Rotaria magnacalcarata]|uniref:Caspase family p20 domain-containing protein n=1 Tax=Rotaria magnacalcarata TaxID=392030 RepID=A0A815RKB0_9BILA|nr:unnamed protein product [Rotaria magnacalcarata]CAF4638028.1 unnamed protein product [Rotaria magnacalcarata]